MRGRVVGVVVTALVAGAGMVGAEGEHDHGHPGHEAAQETAASASGVEEQTLTGEVVDVFCYLSHGKEGLGKGHASCAKQCIQGGLPVAIKVGDQLYLATMTSHEPANKTLLAFAGEQVTVHGKVMEQDGQHLIAVSRVEPAH